LCSPMHVRVQAPWASMSRSCTCRTACCSVGPRCTPYVSQSDHFPSVPILFTKSDVFFWLGSA
jgi:hypothetical protein